MILRFLTSTGARASEICNLEVEHLDKHRPQGWFYKTKRGKDRIFCLSGKEGGKLYKDLLRFMKKYPSKGEIKYIFHAWDSKKAKE